MERESLPKSVGDKSRKSYFRSCSTGGRVRSITRKIHSARLNSGRSVNSVHDTFARAQSAREYYCPRTPRLPPSPMSARDILHQLQHANVAKQRSRSAERRPKIIRELTHREKVKHIELSLQESPEFRKRFSKSFSSSGYFSPSVSFASSDVTATRVKLPKIMPCLRPENVILAQAEQRIARGILAKEKLDLRVCDMKVKSEHKRLAREERIKAQAEHAAMEASQKIMLQTVQACQASVILMHFVVKSRHDKMIQEATANSTRRIKSKTTRRERVQKCPPCKDADLGSSSAFITNPDGTEEYVSAGDGEYIDESNEDEEDANAYHARSEYVKNSGIHKRTSATSSRNDGRVSAEVYARLTASYQVFLQVVHNKKWRLLVALSILRKRVAVRIIKSSIPVLVGQPKFQHGTRYFNFFLHRIRVVQRAARSFLDARIGRIRYLQLEWDREDFAYTKEQLTEKRRQRMRSTIDAKLSRMDIPASTKRQLSIQTSRWQRTDLKMKSLLQKHDEENSVKVESPLDANNEMIVISDDYVEQYMMSPEEREMELFDIVRDKRREHLAQGDLFATSNRGANHSLADAKAFLIRGVSSEYSSAMESPGSHQSLLKRRKKFIIQKFIQPGEIRARVIAAHCRIGTFEDGKTLIYNKTDAKPQQNHRTPRSQHSSPRQLSPLAGKNSATGQIW